MSGSQGAGNVRVAHAFQAPGPDEPGFAGVTPSRFNADHAVEIAAPGLVGGTATGAARVVGFGEALNAGLAGAVMLTRADARVALPNSRRLVHGPGVGVEDDAVAGTLAIRARPLGPEGFVAVAAPGRAAAAADADRVLEPAPGAPAGTLFLSLRPGLGRGWQALLRRPPGTAANIGAQPGTGAAFLPAAAAVATAAEGDEVAVECLADDGTTATFRATLLPAAPAAAVGPGFSASNRVAARFSAGAGQAEEASLDPSLALSPAGVLRARGLVMLAEPVTPAAGQTAVEWAIPPDVAALFLVFTNIAAAARVSGSQIMLSLRVGGVWRQATNEYFVQFSLTTNGARSDSVFLFPSLPISMNPTRGTNGFVHLYPGDAASRTHASAETIETTELNGNLLRAVYSGRSEFDGRPSDMRMRLANGAALAAQGLVTLLGVRT